MTAETNVGDRAEMMMNATTTIGLTPLRRLAALAAAVVLASAALALSAAAADAAFGIKGIDGGIVSEDGKASTQAGAQPYEVWTKIDFNTTTDPWGMEVPDESFKTVEAELPPGLLGNPAATPRCTMHDFMVGDILQQGACADETVIGVAALDTTFGQWLYAPIYNLETDPDQPARFGFHVLSATILLNPKVRTGSDYGITIEIPTISQGLPVKGTELRFWGVPADPSHDDVRGKCMDLVGPTGGECESEADPLAFLTNPTSCVGPVETSVRVNSWQEPAVWHEASYLSHEPEGGPVIGFEGCEEVPFEPSFEVSVQPGEAASPSSLDVGIHLPQHGEPGELATSHLKKAVVTLPEGVTLNAAGAGGLGACSPSEAGIGNTAAIACPDASKIGTVEIDSPLLGEPMLGSVYLGKQGDNPFGSLFAIYLAAEAEGVVVKLPGKIDADASSGRVTATFDNAPQLPFSDLRVSLFGGDGAVLTAPDACGSYSAAGTFTPWSGAAPVVTADSLAVTQGPGGGPCPNGSFEPRFSAGTANPVAGRFSPFVMSLVREDGSQAITGVEATLPQGLLAKLAGVPYCPEAALASIPTAEGSGAGQLAAPSCPAASRVGGLAVASGAGQTPLYLDTGSVYLAGPYKGAPMSLAVVTPALAGPFDLGNVLVRAALHVDPSTAQVKAVSDPLPTMLAGVPLNLREVRVRIDRPEFTLNPTSCDPGAVAGSLRGSGGAVAAVRDRFQAASCGRLGFRPRMKVSLTGGTGRAGNPKLQAVVRPRRGDANLAKVVVALPRSIFLDQSHIRTVCTRVQYRADSCPAGSIYGRAVARTPLLDKPLSGPVYLRSSDNPLPDLVVRLRGQIEVELSGRIDSVDGGLRTTFNVIPDAPLNKFTLQMKGGSRSLLVNSRNLCRAPGEAKVRTEGQNGKTHDFRLSLGARCKGR
jgi:hypothetical protein